LATLPSTPPQILLTLASDVDRSVRLKVAGNANLTPSIAAIMARDPDPEIRETIAFQKILSDQVLVQLLFDFDVGVMTAACRRFYEVVGLVDIKIWSDHLFGRTGDELVAVLKRVVALRLGIGWVVGFAKMLRLIYPNDIVGLVKAFGAAAEMIIDDPYSRNYTLYYLDSPWSLVMAAYLKTRDPKSVAQFLTSDKHMKEDLRRAERLPSRLYLEAAVRRLPRDQLMKSAEVLTYIENVLQETALIDRSETVLIEQNQEIIESQSIDGVLVFPGFILYVPKFLSDLYRIEAQLGLEFVRSWYIAPEDDQPIPIVALVNDLDVAIGVMQVEEDGGIRRFLGSQSFELDEKVKVIVERQLRRWMGKQVECT
jgi:hypothetical protein